MIHLRLFHLFVFVSYLSQAKDAVSLLCIDKLGLALASCWVWSQVQVTRCRYPLGRISDLIWQKTQSPGGELGGGWCRWESRGDRERGCGGQAQPGLGKKVGS